MQLPPGRSLLDWRCVKDTPPAALVPRWTTWRSGKSCTPRFSGFAALHMHRCPYRRAPPWLALAWLATRAAWGYAMFMLSCCVYLLSMFHVRVSVC